MYLTFRILKTIPEDDDRIDLMDIWQDIADLYNNGEPVFQESISWYTCDDDMIEFSKKYPNITFEIYSEGESIDDIWKTYYKNGKICSIQASITFEPYSEDKLIDFTEDMKIRYVEDK